MSASCITASRPEPHVPVSQEPPFDPQGALMPYDPDSDPLAPECGDQLVTMSKAEIKRLIAHAIYRATKDIEVHILALEETVSILGSTMADYSEEIAAINAETDSLSGRIDAVIASLDVDDPAVEAELNAISSRLRGLAADPANPVPDEEPPPVEEPAPEPENQP